MIVRTKRKKFFILVLKILRAKKKFKKVNYANCSLFMKSTTIKPTRKKNFIFVLKI